MRMLIHARYPHRLLQPSSRRNTRADWRPVQARTALHPRGRTGRRGAGAGECRVHACMACMLLSSASMQHATSHTRHPLLPCLPQASSSSPLINLLHLPISPMDLGGSLTPNWPDSTREAFLSGKDTSTSQQQQGQTMQLDHIETKAEPGESYGGGPGEAHGAKADVTAGKENGHGAFSANGVYKTVRYSMQDDRWQVRGCVSELGLG